MNDLIQTIRRRYSHMNSYRNFAVLVYRVKPEAAENEEKHKKGFFSFAHPLLSGISKKLHDEIHRLFERRERDSLQTVTRDIPRLIQQHIRQWKPIPSAKTDKAGLEAAKRIDKRVDLFTADTGSKLNTVRNELNRLKAFEKTQLQEWAKLRRDNPPLSHKAAKRLAAEYAERERAELSREISTGDLATERRVMRKLRDEEEYEKRRRG